MQIYDDFIREHNINIALLIPCFNEELTIGRVIRDFKNLFPSIHVYVFNNASTDNTAQEALKEGATVVTVLQKGKGNVIRRMFAEVDADIYVLVDGDATYSPSSLSEMLFKLIHDRLDMVVGCRKAQCNNANEAYRFGHQWGNRLINRTVSTIFGQGFTDILSGYRVLSRRFVKSFPAISQGFETETELTVHALALKMPIAEVGTPYFARPEGSISKLSTIKDGFRIMNKIARLFLLERPFQFFSLISIMISLFAVCLFLPILIEYVDTGLVPRFPTAILSSSMVICAVLSFICGIILDNVTRGRYEVKRIAYLSTRPLPFFKC